MTVANHADKSGVTRRSGSAAIAAAAIDRAAPRVRGLAASDAVCRFCCGIVDAVGPEAVGVKPQLAFFEALGAPGLQALRASGEKIVRALGLSNQV